jgi:hypothetical protein
MVETTMRIASVILLSKIIFSFCHKLDRLIYVDGDIDMLQTKKSLSLEFYSSMFSKL